MIVVIGSVSLRDDEPEGRAARIALSAAATGARVQLISKVGDDPAGDALLLGLANGGVGHAAILRDAAFSTNRRVATHDVAGGISEPDPEAGERDGGVGVRHPSLDAADVGLALRYLGDYTVLVVADPEASAGLVEATDAARWAGAHLIVVIGPGATPPAALPDDTVVVEADGESSDSGDGLADLLGRYAAAVDRGEAARTSFVDFAAAASGGSSR